jgi:hypothetical protein
VVPGKVCFQAVAKLFSTAEMGRKADISDGCRKRSLWVIGVNSAEAERASD